MEKSMKTLAVLVTMTCAQLASANYPGGKAPVTDIVQTSQVPAYTSNYQGPKLGQITVSPDSMNEVQASNKKMQQTTFCSFINQSLGFVYPTDVSKAVVATAAAAKVKVSDLVVFATSNLDGSSEQVYYSLTNRKFYVAKGLGTVSAAELAVPGTIRGETSIEIFDTDIGEKYKLIGLVQAEAFMKEQLVPGAVRTDSSAVFCKAGNRGAWTMFRVKDPVQVSPKADADQQEESIFDRLKFFIPSSGS